MNRFIMPVFVAIFFSCNMARAGRFGDFLRSLFGKPSVGYASIELEPQFSKIVQLVSYVYGAKKRLLSRQELEQVRSFLESGAFVDERDENWNSTPLMFAVQAADLPLIKLLLDYKADPSAKNGTNSLINYIRNIAALPNIARALNSVSILVSYVTYREQRCLNESELSLIEELLQNDAPIDELDFQLNTSLLTAAQRGDLPLVRLLLKHGADPLARCGFQTPMDIAHSNKRVLAEFSNSDDESFDAELEATVKSIRDVFIQSNSNPL